MSRFVEEQQKRHEVIIVGAGPVGLFLGLSLARKGVEVLVLEGQKEIIPSPRALMHFPVVLQEFQNVGILDDVVKAGYKNQEGLAFRTPGGGSNKLLARIPPGKSATGSGSGSGSGSIDFGVQLGQHRLAEIFLHHASKYPNFRIRYDTKFVDLYEEGSYVYVTTSSNSSSSSSSGKQQEQFVSQFVVACDGASSPIRKCLGIPFEGFTWQDWRFLAINIKYDFEKHGGYSAAQHIIDSDDWAVIARAGSREEGIWRIATGIDPSIPLNEIITTTENHQTHQNQNNQQPWLQAKLERLLPGPRPLNYEILAVNPYWAHERVASTYRQGRVVLCGDAAHINNPLTALGLTTGLVDAAILSRFLAPLFFTTTITTTPPSSLFSFFSSSSSSSSPSSCDDDDWAQKLDKYSTMRRKDYITRVQKQAIEGKLRIHSANPKIVKERDDFFIMLNKNPGFGIFVATSMLETLPDNLEPGPLAIALTSLSQVIKTVGIIARVIVWKIRAAVL